MRSFLRGLRGRLSCSDFASLRLTSSFWPVNARPCWPVRHFANAYDSGDVAAADFVLDADEASSRLRHQPLARLGLLRREALPDSSRLGRLLLPFHVFDIDVHASFTGSLRVPSVRLEYDPLTRYMGECSRA